MAQYGQGEAEVHLLEGEVWSHRGESVRGEK